jgi:hypothetical protein
MGSIFVVPAHPFFASVAGAGHGWKATRIDPKSFAETNFACSGSNRGLRWFARPLSHFSMLIWVEGETPGLA